MADQLDASAQLIYEAETGKAWSMADEDERRIWREIARELQEAIEGPWPTQIGSRTAQ